MKHTLRMLSLLTVFGLAACDEALVPGELTEADAEALNASAQRVVVLRPDHEMDVIAHHRVAEKVQAAFALTRAEALLELAHHVRLSQRRQL